MSPPNTRRRRHAHARHIIVQHLGGMSALGAAFTGYAKGLARGLRLRHARLVRTVAPGVTITIERAGDYARVLIRAGGKVAAAYEFVAAFEWIGSIYYGSRAGFERDGWDTGTAPTDGRLIRTTFAKGALDSTRITFADGTAADPEMPGQRAINPTSRFGPADSDVPLGYGRLRLGSAVWWHRHDPNHAVVSSPALATVNGHSMRGANALGVGGELVNIYRLNNTSRPAVYHANGQMQVIQHKLTGSRRWHRRVALQTVTDPDHGTRTFIITTDAHGDFHIAPMGAAAFTADPFTTTQLSTAGYAQTVSTPWPDWVTITNGRPARDVVWAFNSTGTKAVTTPIAVLPPGPPGSPDLATANFFTSPRSSTFRATYSKLWLASDTPASLSYGLDQLLENDRPGVFEVSIDITLDGPAPEDFTADVKAARTINDDARYPIVADYALPDPRLTALGVNPDDLIVAELNVWIGSYRYPYRPSNLAQPFDPASEPLWNAYYRLHYTEPNQEHLYLGERNAVARLKSTLEFVNADGTSEPVARLLLAHNQEFHNPPGSVPTFAGLGSHNKHFNLTNPGLPGADSYRAYVSGIDCRTLAASGEAYYEPDGQETFAGPEDDVEIGGLTLRAPHIQYAQAFAIGYGETLWTSPIADDSAPIPERPAFEAVDIDSPFTPPRTVFPPDVVERATPDHTATVALYNTLERNALQLLPQCMPACSPDGHISFWSNHFQRIPPPTSHYLRGFIRIPWGTKWGTDALVIRDRDRARNYLLSHRDVYETATGDTVDHDSLAFDSHNPRSTVPLDFFTHGCLRTAAHWLPDPRQPGDRDQPPPDATP